MLANPLTREVGLKVGPVLLEVLVKHYFERLKNDGERVYKKSGTHLKHNDVLYDEAFTIVKAFLNAASFHTVEELQAFSNTRTPSPPWTHVVRIIIPLSTCNDAATYLIQALGGDEVARRVVGGVKWWQVRGIKGVDGQWITAKKDWREAKRRYKMQQQQKGTNSTRPSEATKEKEVDPGCYEKDMDEMRCILYLHGGGYYFGSVDQERYTIQRFARKINGRVFAINYRLAPQYPFPCGLQDAVAAYLFLIRPPVGSAHRLVRPEHIIIAGDSAGGGLSLALLQVIRDSGLPKPAGAFLISPWCDLTHSFPSVHTNTDTDVIPPFGLSFHKPSTLWPPPSPDISSRVHASLRNRIRQTFKMEDHESYDPVATMLSERQPSGLPVDIGATTPVPPLDAPYNQKVTMKAANGEELEIGEQIHLYTENSLLVHPLVSPALSYLGGLPPLLIIASDKEVLRDEIIYVAHKAANPGKYPIKPHVRDIYPSLEGIEERHEQPTSVHLQVYDDAAHILPVLFSFTNPAKFCFRAIATFCKFATGMGLQPSTPLNGSFSNLNITRYSSPNQETQDTLPSLPSSSVASTSEAEPRPVVHVKEEATTAIAKKTSRKSLRRALTSRITQAGKALRKRAVSVDNIRRHRDPSTSSDPVPPVPRMPGSHRDDSNASSDVGGPRFHTSTSTTSILPAGERTAGDQAVYTGIGDYTDWNCEIIRERVSTQGVIRPLEPESELDAFQIPTESIGVLSELAVRRYINAQLLFTKKFSSTIKSIEKHRHRNLERAKADTIKSMSALRNTLKQNEVDPENLMSSPGWGWAWALDAEEDPPPSSIVSRRDTEEARRLAEIADQAILGGDHAISGNNLWSVVINYLTVNPGKQGHEAKANSQVESSTNVSVAAEGVREKCPSRLSRLMTWERPSSSRGKGE
ncbi:hypothetical protein BDQ12DRAFT_641990 [Crucibulum laeve]|uniref:Alpha/beta hydrolase fold-3 domain-containing protein n=1 Tax=Crucibulum laeve TaxID=68775 RepID=A0A5C3MU69_9AGAR|nr:hypothetical protein BDQ12DRAFT_641990 [Crucibulum laeve]